LRAVHFVRTKISSLASTRGEIGPDVASGIAGTHHRYRRQALLPPRGRAQAPAHIDNRSFFLLALQYSHRLPADYDMHRIRERAARRGPLWDGVEGLVFKAFVARQRGRDGAIGNVYASVYLWHDSQAAAQFLMGERFQAVIDSFGRPRVESWLPLQAVAGRGGPARALYREERVLDAGLDRAELLEAERASGRRVADQADTVAVWSALDLRDWRLVRFTLSSAEPDAARAAAVYEVLHLAAPGRAVLR